MPFRDLDEFLVVQPFVLPVRGKDYEFPGEVSARVWLKLQALSDQLKRAQAAELHGEDYEPDSEVLSDTDEAEMRREMFGGVEEEMANDGCSSGQMKAVFYTLIAYHLSGREAAEAVWNSQGNLAAPNRETRRKAASPRRGNSRASLNAAPKTEETSEAGETSLSTGS